MNKAFVREPDCAGTYCPRCGSQGEQVGAEVLKLYLADDQGITLTPPAHFCPSPKCAVAYFDSFERFVLVNALSRPAYPKDPTAPLCACFGVTRQDIEQDVDEGVVTRTKAAVERAKSPLARCAQTAANGRPCVAHLQKYYLECRQRRGVNRGRDVIPRMIARACAVQVVTNRRCDVTQPHEWGSDRRSCTANRTNPVRNNARVPGSGTLAAAASAMRACPSAVGCIPSKNNDSLGSNCRVYGYVG